MGGTRNGFTLVELLVAMSNLLVQFIVAMEASNVGQIKELGWQFNQATNSPTVAAVPAAPKQKIKIACVGDSITYGAGIKDRSNNSYPALLQKMLGDSYDVRNFGYSGATLLKKGHKPYWSKAPYAKSIEFEPDVVIVNLGANDAVNTNWKFASDFSEDYEALIQTYRDLASKPIVFVCEILPIFPNHGRYQECTTNRVPITKMIRKIAASESTELIDLHSPFVSSNNLFSDGLHPKKDGALVMASHIFRSLTNKQPPNLSIVRPQEFSDENETSFEKQTAGTFTKFETNVGTWQRVKGKVLIDNQHAKSGKQCLQIAGGNGASVELDITDDIEAGGLLSFWAERWTSRGPFSFRIEKQSGGKWSEIYVGDKTVQVGRSFRSHIMVSLGDGHMSRLRFSVTSPANTGVLIDDLKIVAAEPMEVANIEVVPLALPALVGTEASAIVKLKVTTKGTLNPLSVNKIVATLVGASSRENMKHIQTYFSGSDSNFRWDTPIGPAADPRPDKAQTFKCDQKLADGDNYIWLACQLKGEADIDTTISAEFNSISFSNGESKVITGRPSVQRLGLAVRKGRDDKVHTYRIPGLATTNNGSLIGVYDVRHDGGGDLPGNIDVGMSRSTDGGRNWEPMKVIMDMGDDRKWLGDGIGDPSVLVDRTTGTIWVSATWSHGNRSWRGSGPGLEPEETGQWMLVKSDDDGVTWSKPINITKQVKNPEWSFLLQGPGKGITMFDGTIVFPAQYQDAPNAVDKKVNRLPHSNFIYSRDHGKTWAITTGAWDDTTESQIVELADGKLMLNCRNNRASKRAIMVTNDMGNSWNEHSTHVKSLIEPGSCMASLINVGRELRWRNINSDFANEFLLFSNPDSLRGRNHITIKASMDSGSTWPAKHQLLLDEQGGAGYSCMSMIDVETVGILYEGSQAHMTFQRVKVKDILNPPTNQKTKNPAFAFSQPDNQTQPKVSQLSLARPFGNHMVLQANQPIRIWGKSKPSDRVKVDFMGKSNSTHADENGSWLVELPTRNGYVRTGQELVVSSKSDRIVIRDVLVGEVWICAGQSNMEFKLSKSKNGNAAVKAAGDKLLRLHNCPGGARGGSGVYSEKQISSLWPKYFSRGQWKIDSANSASSFSAVGYYFAKRLRTELDIPVGMINVSVGGTPIESWVSPERLQANQDLAPLLKGNWLDNPMLDDWCKRRARSNLKRGLAGELKIPGDEFGPNHSFKPGFMHAAGIKPFAPLSIKGGLWYQGESNVDNPKRTRIYDACFPQLVDDWRQQFQNKNLPVIFVQLPALGRPNWPVFREYQRRSLAKLRNVGMAITIDTGHPTDVHPRDKLPVGNRLAQWALIKVYGRNGLAMGPVFKSKSAIKNVLEILFDHVGDELITSNGQAPSHFEIAGSDGVFHPAKAQIVDRKVKLTSDQVRFPIQARYAWKPFPNSEPNLANSVGLPASPFTTEHVFH